MKINFKFLLLGIILLVFGYETVADPLLDEEFDLETLLEGTVFVAASVMLVREVLNNLRIQKTVKAVQQQNYKLSIKLSDLIESSFENWSLTRAERETAWLLIKGFSISEIALLRKVKDKTVHHQLTSIYAKSETRNRSEFTSNFIQLIFDEQTLPAKLVKKSTHT